MKRYQALAVILGMIWSASAHAEDVAEVHIPSRAVWIEPMDGQAPWLDVRKQSFSAEVPEIKATGGAYALVRMADGKLYAVDEAYKVLGAVELPAGTTWYAVDGNGRILAHDGAHIWGAGSYGEAAQASGFVSMLDVSNVRAIDLGGDILAYGDAEHVTLVDMKAGTLKRIAAADFFDDAKVAAMTPEAVEKAEKSKRKATHKKVTKDAETQVADIQGIWWRADGVGVLSIRSLMSVRTFVTTDNGRSWRQMSDAPADIRHSFGWIWDGKDRVLSRDGGSWVQVCGEKYAPADRWTLGHARETVASVPGQWVVREQPAAVAMPEAGAAEAGAAGAQESCVDVGWLPVETATLAHKVGLNQTGLYSPLAEPGGFEMGLYREPAGGAPAAWIIEDGKLSSVDLPAGCDPLYVAGVSGLGIAYCKLNAEEFTVHTRTSKMPWIAETILPVALAQDPKVYVSEDGSVFLRGGCEKTQKELPVMPDEESMASGGEVPTETVISEYCRVAVRQPEEAGYPNIWRLENLESGSDVVPLTNGRLVSVEPDGSGKRKLVLRTAQQTDVVAESFDPAPYSGLVSTPEGCLALYDGTIGVDELRAGDRVDASGNVIASKAKLLSTSGRMAELDCASSQAIVASESENAYTFEEPAGEDRFGLRASAGAFFAMKNVITWAVRVEGLIPIYRGQYEVSVMYRMAGGNVSSALGHIGMASIRWRYNNFELFDFAVGAGIGYGTMCGYDKKQDPNAMDEDDATLPSGYSYCSAASMRYEISGFATYKFSSNWKLFISAHLLGGENWGVDLAGGLEVRF